MKPEASPLYWPAVVGSLKGGLFGVDPALTKEQQQAIDRVKTSVAAYRMQMQDESMTEASADLTDALGEAYNTGISAYRLVKVTDLETQTINRRLNKYTLKKQTTAPEQLTPTADAGRSKD